MMKCVLAALLATVPFATVLAATPSNVFLSGQVLRDDEVITSFAAPILLGATLPVSDQVSSKSGKVGVVKLALTPTKSAGGSFAVSVKGDWSERLDSVAQNSKDGISTEWKGAISNQVELAPGQTQVIPLGKCNTAIEKLADKVLVCSLKLVLSARAQ
ncbi:hypothetical protein [Pseudomonas sp. F1002]|uniref:hypothetical protein n=1 Tax=Pseudomonas sp. F1002 TaxID=2738821 RepID=UPI0015A342D1|nr:hypothetical protein [Pseudomonas sp. F1002]NWB63551.1 hypothetical protein [Pseudomonas sp. F1002]